MYANIIVLETISSTTEDIITRVWTDLFLSTTTHFAKPTNRSSPDTKHFRKSTYGFPNNS